VRYALPAAAAAADALAYEEAASLQERALDALNRLPADRRRERLAILESLGRLRWQAGDTEAAREAFRAKARLARTLGDGEQLARAALGFGGRWYDAERADDELVALLREALDALPDSESPLRAKAMARLAQALRPADPGGAAGLGRAALAMARRIGHDEALIDALAALHAALLHVEHLDERLALGAEWLALAGRGSHRDDTLALACNWRIYDLYEAGDVAGARAQHERLQALAASLRQPLYFNFATSWEFKWLESAGRFDDALAKARESHRYGRRAHGSYVDSLFAGQVFGVLRDQGRLPEVFAVVEQFMGGVPTLGVWRTGIVLADVHAGREDRARHELQAFVDERFASIPRDGFWLPAMCILAEAAAALHHTTAAAALRDALAPFAHCNAQIGLAIFLGPVALFSGMAAATLGRREDAERDFGRAITQSAALGARTSETYAQCACGEMLCAAGGDGRALLRAARAGAEELGMATILKRATRGLGDGG
jgi:tetratricopeptide (TPR) repeat protein